MYRIISHFKLISYLRIPLGLYKYEKIVEWATVRSHFNFTQGVRYMISIVWWLPLLNKVSVNEPIIDISLWMHLHFLSFYSMSCFFSRRSYKYCTDFVQIKCYFPRISNVYFCISRSHDTDTVLCHMAETSLMKWCPDIGCFSLGDCLYMVSVVWWLTSLNKWILSSIVSSWWKP